jgi:uncharacterized protein
MRRVFLILPLLLAACGSTEGPLRYPVTVPPAEAPVRISFDSIEVREAVLPLYAELEEIYILGPDGALHSDTEVLWADEPRRAVTQGLVSALARLTGARVAAEPWPLEDFPAARLEVRFDQLMAQSRGAFVASGQYYVADLEGGRSRSGGFALSVPITAEGPAALARAKGELLGRLARQIADEAL